MTRMPLTCGYWEVVDEVEPIALFYYQTPGSYFYACLLCHAMLVDVDWVSVSMIDVRL